jgi:hypothetical protein
MTDDIWRLAECCWESTAAARPSINDICDSISPSVKLHDNYPAVGGPERPDRDEAPQLSDDISCLAKRTPAARSPERTLAQRPRSPERPPVRRALSPERSPLQRPRSPALRAWSPEPPPVLLARSQEPPPVRHARSPEPVPKPPPSAYDRLQAGATFQETSVIRTPYNNHLWAVAMTLDGKIIASSGVQKGDKDEGLIQIWDLASGARRRSLQGHTAYVSCLAFFRNGWLVSGSWDGTVRLWDLASSAMMILRHDDIITCISLSSDNKTVATRVWHGSIRLWDATTGHLMHTLENPECDGITSISISSDATSLVAFGYHVSRVDRWWVATLWKQLHDGKWAIDVHRKIECRLKGRVVFSSCSSSGPRVALSDDDHLAIYGVHRNESYETHIDEGGGKAKFSPDGNWLVGRANYKTGGRTGPLRKRALKIWDATSGKMLSELLSVRYADVDAVSISHDGSTILAGDGPLLRVFVLTDM